MCPVLTGGILAGLVSDYTGGRATTCCVMLLIAAPMVSLRRWRFLHLPFVRLLKRKGKIKTNEPEETTLMCFSDLVPNSKLPTFNAQAFPNVGLSFKCLVKHQMSYVS